MEVTLSLRAINLWGWGKSRLVVVIGICDDELAMPTPSLFDWIKRKLQRVSILCVEVLVDARIGFLWNYRCFRLPLNRWIVVHYRPNERFLSLWIIDGRNSILCLLFTSMRLGYAELDIHVGAMLGIFLLIQVIFWIFAPRVDLLGRHLFWKIK